MAHVGPEQLGDETPLGTPIALAADAETAAANVTRPLANSSGVPRVVESRLHTPLGRILAWGTAGKAHTLVFAIMPVLVAGALLSASGEAVSYPRLLALALGAALVLGGANLLDAYLEYVRAHALSRVHPSTSISLRAARHRTVLPNLAIYPLDAMRVGVIVLAVGAAFGLPAALAAGIPGLLLGGAGLIAAFLYSATSVGLKRHPLGELAVLAALGPGLFILAVLAQHAPLTGFSLALGVALGLYSLAALEAANIRAITPEERDGRRTAIRLLGEHAGRVFFIACLAAAYLTVLIAAALPGSFHGAFAVLFSLPLLVVPATGIWRAHSADTLTPAVRGMLRAYAFFAFWIIAGLLIGALYLRLLTLIGL